MKTLLMKIYFFILIIGSTTVHAAGVDTRVTQELATTGQAKTIIALNVSDAAPSRLRTSRAAVSRDPIGETQEIVLNDLPAGSYELTYQYSHVPGLAMTLTPASFEILKDHPQVKYIQFDELEHIALAEAVPLINANDVHNGVPAYNGSGVTVAVLDSGINTLHDYFASKIQVQHCALSSGCPATGNVAEDGNGHGSHVSGIVTKVAPGAKIAAVKVCNDSGGCQLSDTIAGLNWVAANHSTNAIKIVNMSLASNTLYSDSCDVEDATRKAAVDALINAGITVFAAAGNDGGTPSGKSTLAAPACLSNTIAVGATYDRTYPSPTGTSLVCSKIVDDANTVTCFSNSSLWLDILAPGSEITSSSIETTTATQVKAGTSMATPMASGVAALMLQKNTLLTPAQIKAKLKKTGTNVTDTNSITRPRIDALAAVNDASTAQPIIEVIANGKTLPDQSVLDFGQTTLGSSVTKTLTIKNIGDAVLNLALSGIPTGFSTTPSTLPTIGANSQQTLEIKLDAMSENDYMGTLQLDDLKFPLKGKVACAVQSLPFAEDFEHWTIPNCWKITDNNHSDPYWKVSPNFLSGGILTPISGNYSVGVEDSGATQNDDWLILPKISLGNNSLFRFTARSDATNNETFEIWLSTSGSNITNFIKLDTKTVTPIESPNNCSLSLSGYAGQNIYLAIRSISPAANGSTIVIDDVLVTDSSPPNYLNSTPKIDNFTTTGATLTVQLDEAGTVYYLVKTDSSVASAGAPNATQVMAGQSFAVNAANTDINQLITGLSPNTAYTIYFVAKDVSGNTSAVTSKNFTTAVVATDTTPPSFINSTPSISEVTTSGFTLTLGSNETGTVHYLVLPTSSSVPAATTIKSSGTLANLSTNTPISTAITGLNANTSYTVYAVLTDSVFNESAVTSTSSTTASIPQTPTTSTPSTPPSYTVIERKDGTGSGRITSIYVGKSTWTPMAALSATPDPGSVFVKWTGNIHSQDCYSDQPTIYVRLNAIKTCTATFDQITADNQSLVPVKLAAYYLPGRENSGKALIRITNTNLTPVEVKGTLYHASGQMLGIANSVIIPTLAPQATVELSTIDLAKSCSAPAWTGLAWLHFTTPTGLKLLNLLENDNTLISNFTSPANDNTLYNLPASTNAEQANIVLINTSDKIQPVTATLYADSGQILGKANTILADVAARGIFTLSIKQLELLVYTVPWTNHVAKLQITSPLTEIKAMATLLSNDATVMNLTPTHDNAAFNVPGATNLDQAFVYVSNTTNSSVQVQATLYHQDGYLLGNSNTILANTLAPQATQLFSVSELEKIFNVPTWQKRARLMITSPTTGIKVMTLIRNSSGVSNISAVTTHQAFYLPNATDVDKAYVRMINLTDLPVTVTGVAYAENGQILGSGILTQLAAQTTTVLSMPLLESYLKITSWNGKMRLVINPAELQIMGTIRSNTGQLVDMSDVIGD